MFRVSGLEFWGLGFPKDEAIYTDYLDVIWGLDRPLGVLTKRNMAPNFSKLSHTQRSGGKGFDNSMTMGNWEV